MFSPFLDGHNSRWVFLEGGGLAWSAFFSVGGEAPPIAPLSTYKGGVRSGITTAVALVKGGYIGVALVVHIEFWEAKKHASIWRGLLREKDFRRMKNTAPALFCPTLTTLLKKFSLPIMQATDTQYTCGERCIIYMKNVERCTLHHCILVFVYEGAKTGIGAENRYHSAKQHRQILSGAVRNES